MKSNFHIEASQKNHEYHIHLHGIFDGASAFELLNVIRNGEQQGLTIFIDTSHLTKALPFGRAILESNLPKNGTRTRLHFKGAWADDILPAGCNRIPGNSKKGHDCRGNCSNCPCSQEKPRGNSILKSGRPDNSHGPWHI